MWFMSLICRSCVPCTSLYVTGITPIEALVLLGTYTDERLLMTVTHNFALRSLARVKVRLSGGIRDT